MNADEKEWKKAKNGEFSSPIAATGFNKGNWRIFLLFPYLNSQMPNDLRLQMTLKNIHLHPKLMAKIIHLILNQRFRLAPTTTPYKFEVTILPFINSKGQNQIIGYIPMT